MLWWRILAILAVLDRDLSAAVAHECPRRGATRGHRPYGGRIAAWLAARSVVSNEDSSSEYHKLTQGFGGPAAPGRLGNTIVALRLGAARSKRLVTIIKHHHKWQGHYHTHTVDARFVQQQQQQQHRARVSL